MEEVSESDLEEGVRLAADDRSFGAFFEKEYARLARALFLITGYHNSGTVLEIDRCDPGACFGSHN
jgi:hypothetical protein